MIIQMKRPSLFLMIKPLCFITITIFFILLTTPTSHGTDDEHYTQCSQLYECGGDIKEIGYPFWGEGRPRSCGLQGFELTCHYNEYTTLDIDTESFRVLDIDQYTHIMTVARMDMWDNLCPQEFINTTSNATLFVYLPNVRNLSLFYNCSSGSSSRLDILFRYHFTCAASGGGGEFFLVESSATARLPEPEQCGHNLSVPVLQEALDEFRRNESMTLQDVLNRGFAVDYENEMETCEICVSSGGICGTDTTTYSPTCFCRNGPNDLLACPDRGDKIDWAVKLGIGFGAAGFTLLVMGLAFIYYSRNKKRNAAAPWVTGNTSCYTTSMADLKTAGTCYGIQTFSYNELEKATNKFDSSKELGDGGFGTVYQGKLRDGRVVAVKRLYEHNYKRVEQFMNEVEILTRLRHQNLVSLYGCTSHHCRELLLVYEYIPNGTVADHLHGQRAKPGSLSLTTRMSIAIETASALAYLHASDVIHRDVKTNNILLDSNFCVKVADFGLSRLFPTDVTHVSTAPQGTPGYVDPEYHQCYQLTGKSDVYSFGVVLIELISSKPAVDITRHRHEINLSNMAINKIQNHALHELVDPCLGFESDYKVRKMITEVAELAFQCLQNGGDMRPSMEKVLEALMGIRSEDYKAKNAVEVDIPADDVVLLKSDPPTVLSPDSVMANWISRGATPNASS